MEVSTLHLVFILLLVLMISLFIINPIESIKPANYKEGLDQNMIDAQYAVLNNYASSMVSNLKGNSKDITDLNTSIVEASTRMTTSDFFKNFSMSKSNFLPLSNFLTQDTKNGLIKIINRLIQMLEDINNNLKPNTKTW